MRLLSFQYRAQNIMGNTFLSEVERAHRVKELAKTMKGEDEGQEKDRENM